MRKVYLNHDGGVDDLVGLFLLLQMKDVKVTGVGVTPADCYVEPAVLASRKIIDKFGGNQNIEVAASNSRAKNPFPKEWRMHAFTINALPILNEYQPVKTPQAEVFAHDHLIQILQKADQKVDLIFLGPLTDLARALQKQPEIEEKIGELYWMGGTFLDKGNVEEPEHDGSAEWNAFWDPEAVASVWHSNIKINLIALESTNKVPLTNEVRDQWAKNRADEGLDFLGQAYAIVPPLLHFQTNSTYFLWDVLTTIVFGDSSLVEKKFVPSVVVEQGPSQGKLMQQVNGREVSLVYSVDRTAFFEYISKLASQRTLAEGYSRVSLEK
ncbi:ABC transporter substrate-binding protein [Tetragenococcus halophilus]|uniref:ABC transporter substrate-binding protein n=1 Tax=Tetragenococcus halophilus TaxID=51669 RepID=A0A3G5FI40_TETHA|nr:nucleoside hydrolase [Tetragenococcus halophilus]AYW49798.1 ABC transporter substrate-binding protein [Tetragenococcus halophilus]GBD64509.1 Inosine-uridine preferring nucleoside hydrolase [Tetragenococcus halophilus subsp. flandriensis]